MYISMLPIAYYNAYFDFTYIKITFLASKNVRNKRQFEEAVSQKSSYFANRIRIKDKSICASVMNRDNANVPASLPENDISNNMNRYCYKIQMKYFFVVLILL